MNDLSGYRDLIASKRIAFQARGIDKWRDLSPFLGIGSEGWGALRAGRRFIGTELKASYFRQAVKNLKMAEDTGGAGLFECMEPAA